MTDITELAQLRGRTVDYPHYLVECDCGKIYPSSELSGGEPMGDSGDYSDCYCPHCGEGEEHFAECADPETAWKAQQDKIDALVEALEKAQAENEYIRKRYQQLDLLIGKNILVMQAAIIEWQATGDAKNGLAWIYNTLFGPGELPDEAEKDAQPISTANMLRSMKSLWRFTSGFGNKARLNVPPLASRWRLSDVQNRKFRTTPQAGSHRKRR